MVLTASYNVLPATRCVTVSSCGMLTVLVPVLLIVVVPPVIPVT
jgi:hypothetical protein